uniref:ATP-dependent DNA helicase n=1 Tax=Nicotiana sylvestris TaxID=4096 RepID=A0A1U7YKR8_NICSY|nr:PREDICTED: ATP-dependent DNA helicase PIF1-like [Nicotiana sylvestris]
MRILVRKCEEFDLTDDELKNRCLQKLENFLKGYGRSFQDFPTMPTHVYKEEEVDISNRLIRDELCCNRRDLAEEHEELVKNLTNEQNCIYKRIITAVNEDKGEFFFLYGFGGTCKTFIWRTVSFAIRSKGDIVLTVASSEIASLLLPGGLTAHSRFVIPLNLTEYSTCNIKQSSLLANSIVKAKLIIWDEAPMMHRYCFDVLDRTLRGILRFKDASNLGRPFGGKIVILGGDFIQILHVIPKGTRQGIVNASLYSSYLWSHCQLLTLTKNMGLQSHEIGPQMQELKVFSDWILAIGDGMIDNSVDGNEKVKIPDDLLIKDSVDPISAIVEKSINKYMISLNHIPEKSYLSSDTICSSDQTYSALKHVHTPEILNTIKCSGVPNHALTLKVGVPMMLLRNIDQSAGLCNGTKLIITKLGNQVIEAKVLSGHMAGQKVVIPRMTLTPSDARILFKIQRRQFSITASFAMTINKSQGQSLSYVGLFLKKPLFTHGQLYAALSGDPNTKSVASELPTSTPDESNILPIETTDVLATPATEEQVEIASISGVLVARLEQPNEPNEVGDPDVPASTSSESVILLIETSNVLTTATTEEQVEIASTAEALVAKSKQPNEVGDLGGISKEIGALVAASKESNDVGDLGGSSEEIGALVSTFKQPNEEGF